MLEFNTSKTLILEKNDEKGTKKAMENACNSVIYHHSNPN
jgi:hypothetical protein